VCVCSLRYPACYVHAPYCHMSLSLICVRTDTALTVFLLKFILPPRHVIKYVCYSGFPRVTDGFRNDCQNYYDKCLGLRWFTSCWKLCHLVVLSNIPATLWVPAVILCKSPHPATALCRTFCGCSVLQDVYVHLLQQQTAVLLQLPYVLILLTVHYVVIAMLKLGLP